MAGKVTHKWAFKPGMRAGAYSWKSSAKAIERLKSASSEIRAVARTDPSWIGAFPDYGGTPTAARGVAPEIRLRHDAVPKGCPFLFPGDVPGQPVVDLKRFWERMRVQADISDVRILDLRHTFASLLVSAGASLEMIGRLLRHTQIGTTQGLPT